VDNGFDLDGDGFTSCNGDCDDSSAAVSPSALELCYDAIDNDCDGITLSADADGDGFQSMIVCLADGDDCDDGEVTVYPFADDICDDGIDQDCYQGDLLGDLDGDGFDDPICGGLDCDDGDDWVYPGAFELCDNVDNNCSGSVDDSFWSLQGNPSWIPVGLSAGGWVTDSVPTCLQVGVSFWYSDFLTPMTPVEVNDGLGALSAATLTEDAWAVDASGEVLFGEIVVLSSPVSWIMGNGYTAMGGYVDPPVVP